jgi:hypothetical protein
MQDAFETNLPVIATAEHTAALKEYRETLQDISNELRRSRIPSLEQVERVRAARLRLENARTFLEMCIHRPALGALAPRGAVTTAAQSTRQTMWQVP